ncbi:MAG: hypothetical protein V1824_03660 [archaeon]
MDNTINNYLILLNFAKKNIDLYEKKKDSLLKRKHSSGYIDELTFYYFSYSQIVFAIYSFLKETKIVSKKEKNELFPEGNNVGTNMTSIVYHLSICWRHKVDVFTSSTNIVVINKQNALRILKKLPIQKNVGKIKETYLTTDFENKPPIPKYLNTKNLKIIFLKSYYEIWEFVEKYIRKKKLDI